MAKGARHVKTLHCVRSGVGGGGDWPLLGGVLRNGTRTERTVG